MNKRGFTLIELLAVIVILAIIALIATPIILSMINNARKSAAKSSAYGYFEAIDSHNGFVEAEVDGYTNKIEDGTHQVSDISVKMKGKAPESGTVKIVNGKVKEANICIGGYTVTYNITTSKEAQVGSKCGGGSSASANTAYTLGQLVQYDPVANTSCTTGTTCYKWRVITVGDTTSDSSITLQMDHNLVSKGKWNPSQDNSLGPTEALSELATQTASWHSSLLLNYTYDTTDATNNYGVLTCTNGTCTITGNSTPLATNLKARMITGEEVTAITKTKAPSLGWTIESSNNDMYFFSYTTKQIGTYTSGTGDTDLKWLIENTTSDSSSGATNDAYNGVNNNGYWTMSPVDDVPVIAWTVTGNGYLGRQVTNAYNNFGFRPVITIQKSVLQ